MTICGGIHTFLVMSLTEHIVKDTTGKSSTFQNTKMMIPCIIYRCKLIQYTQES